MLTDAGALIALVDDNDPWHTACTQVAASLTAAMVTTWLTYGEAYYLLGRDHGRPGQEGLWNMIREGLLEIYANPPEEAARMQELVTKYRDIERGGMDLGDASLVVAAETLGLREVFTIDSHFYAYQLADGNHLTVRPGAR